ncbi:collagen alpha-2(I) chain-like [Choloepus didactylus]|uniref:collagen alpha-2(I) chain-like n=1 Tax=Choloepus didactylus TaxID=27675 RepID=UPI0018A0FE33|nr:collagen alpha-2(I) chain-like [Choloepus didactylus]
MGRRKEKCKGLEPEGEKRKRQRRGEGLRTAAGRNTEQEENPARGSRQLLWGRSQGQEASGGSGGNAGLRAGGRDRQQPGAGGLRRQAGWRRGGYLPGPPGRLSPWAGAAAARSRGRGAQAPYQARKRRGQKNALCESPPTTPGPETGANPPTPNPQGLRGAGVRERASPGERGRLRPGTRFVAAPAGGRGQSKPHGHVQLQRTGKYLSPMSSEGEGIKKYW